MRQTDPKLVIFCHQMKLSVLVINFIQLSSFCQKKPVIIPKQSRLLLRLCTGRSLQTKGKILLLKTTPTQLIEHGEGKLVLTENFHSTTSLFDKKKRYPTCYQKRNVSTDLCINPSNYNSVLTARHNDATVAPSLWE